MMVEKKNKLSTIRLRTVPEVNRLTDWVGLHVRFDRVKRRQRETQNVVQSGGCGVLEVRRGHQVSDSQEKADDRVDQMKMQI